ncbi:NUC189-domain-containing protein [Auriscalpium vulgare]|uniref:NUC189-domain-containing protein n=1 Tax=Auriscalpium vulgare TaxID=40419 RepID=A0ACB8RV08_9AGAM|nr:NUC189-domain-containing protein [Auriscalpium vulgare]
MASNASKKAKRSRPASTSALSQPVVEDSSAVTSLSAFSPKGDLFAFLSLAVDKHRLRVYDTTTGQSLAQYIVDAARVTALSWTHLAQLSDASTTEKDGPAPKRKRRKRPSEGASKAEAEAEAESAEVVVLGLSNGSLLVYSPSHGRVVRTLSHPSSTASILALDVAPSATSPSAAKFWTSGADGCIRVWDAQTGEHVSSTKTDDRVPGTSLSVRPRVPSSDEGEVSFLLAHHNIRMLASHSASAIAETPKPKVQSTFTGHASSILSLQWQPASSEGVLPTRFASLAEADRHVYLWDVPQPSSAEGKLVASVPLDSDARHMTFSESPSNPVLLVLSASGRLAIFTPSADLATALPTKKSKQKVPTLSARTTINISVKQSTAPVKIVAASFVRDERGRIRVARLAGGVKPVFDVVDFLDTSGEYIPDIEVVHKDAGAGLANDDESVSGAPNQRYVEPASLAVRSGGELGQDAATDDLDMRDATGDLDVDLAELSLGQRLTALNPSAPRPSDSDADADSDSGRAPEPDAAAPSAITLTRTLIQALHSADTGLLETCLAHTDAALIMHTVRRLPPQLAVPLLHACVERLSRGRRGGRGGAAGSQRAAGLLRWVKTVLVVHSAHLMTMPDLVARLASLHATLTARLALQESLLALSGRLDMVLQQIELRGTAAPAPLAQPARAQKKGKGRKKSAREPTRYVEGESEDEGQDDDAMEVEVEHGSDAESVEDVELGGQSGSEESDEEYEEEEDEEEDEDGEEDDSEEDDEGDEGQPRLNGFIDDEAEDASDDAASD